MMCIVYPVIQDVCVSLTPYCNTGHTCIVLKKKQLAERLQCALPCRLTVDVVLVNTCVARFQNNFDFMWFWRLDETLNGSGSCLDIRIN